jgi:RimJ/RimL family protein N-acetyltransferase
MRLRKLIFDDAKYMMEYLNDEEISVNFRFTRASLSIDNYKEFIKNSWSDKQNIHFAIEDSDGEYAGTISLKNIDNLDKTAEYAIIIRKKYWGTGIAKEATSKMIEYGFNNLNLRKIYLNVLSTNERANKFYKKFGFNFEGTFKKHILINGKYVDLNWYCLFNDRQSFLED